jgi:aminoglycoside phosphotransferase (APT) family kinase protein
MTPPPFDVAALEAFLCEQGLCRGPLSIKPIGDGHSNLTYLVADSERRLVLRRPPAGPLPPGGHDVLREARIQQALSDSDVPVAPVVAVDDSRRVMDAPFYVMEHLDGTVATTATPQELDTPVHREAIGGALVAALAALHRIDPRDVGLEDLGRPSSGTARHLRRFARIADPGGDGLTGELGALLEWLIVSAPAPASPTVVHGDFRLGNIMWAPGAPPRIIAVFDWELATIGDPLRDLGYFLATYAVPGEDLHALTAMCAATLAEGYPTRQQLAARYAAATGADLADIAWYMAMALWKLAILFEYQRRRVEAGAGDDYYAQPGLVEGLLAAAQPMTTGVAS